MMQRIQSVYLFLSSVASILFLFLPFGNTIVDGSAASLNPIDEPIFIVLCGIISIIGLVSIFLFRNRKLQMNIILINILCVFALIGFSVYNYINLKPLDFKFGIALFMPIFILIFSVLAYLGVKSDEKLIDSMNRLR